MCRAWRQVTYGFVKRAVGAMREMTEVLWLFLLLTHDRDHDVQVQKVPSLRSSQAVCWQLRSSCRGNAGRVLIGGSAGLGAKSPSPGSAVDYRDQCSK